MWGAAPILFWCARCSGTLVWGPPAAATPAGAGPAASPPPASRSLLGGGASSWLWGGGGPLLWLPSWGRMRGGGVGGPPPASPPRRASACLPLSPACPLGVYSRSGGCRAAAGVGRGPVGHRRVNAAGGGGDPPALVRAPVFPGPASDKAAPFAPSWAPPVRRRPAAGRLCGLLPRPWCPRTPGTAASSGGVRGRRFFGLPLSAVGPEWEGGGSGGGPLVPWRCLLTAEGGPHGGPGPGGQPSAGGSNPSPAPLYLEPDPRAGPRWGPSSPRPSSRGGGWPGAAVRVGGQRLAGCGAAGSPPRSLSRSPSRGRWRALLRHTVPWRGRGSGGPAPPPHFLAPAVWAVSCAAACVGAGAVAAAGCAGGSASGRGRCVRPGGASCWRPHP